MTASVISTLVSAGITTLFTALASYAVVLSTLFLIQDAYACYNELDDQLPRDLDAAHGPPTKVMTHHDDEPVLSHDISDKPHQALTITPHPTTTTRISTTNAPHHSTRPNLAHLQSIHSQHQGSSRVEHLSTELLLLNQAVAQIADINALITRLGASIAARPSLQQTQPLHSRAISKRMVHDLLEGTQRSHQGVAETEQQRERPSELEFLDLPGEIGNVIYGLICDKSTGVCVGSILPPTKDGPSIAIVADNTPLYISPMAMTCRQIREEYLSMLSAQHRIGLSTLRVARPWHVVFHPEHVYSDRVGRYKIWSIKQIITVPVGIPLKPRKARSCVISVSSDRLKVKIQCRYCVWKEWRTASFVSMVFRFDCEHNIGLAQSSQDAIKALLTRNVPGERAPSFAKFLIMANQIAGLDLQLGVVIPPKKTGLITPSPRSTFIGSLQFGAHKPKVFVE